MTRDDIIRLAREAGFDVEVQDIFKYKPQHSFIGIDENIERFAALVAAAEREACAKLFDGAVWAYDYREIAAAIRARADI